MLALLQAQAQRDPQRGDEQDQREAE